MYNFPQISKALPKYKGAIDCPYTVIDAKGGSCLAFAANLGAQAQVRNSEEPLILRVSSKKHDSGYVSSHFMATDPKARIVSDMLASGPREICLNDLRMPFTNYQMARDRLLRVAISAHLRGDEDPVIGEETIEDERSGSASTIRMVKIGLQDMLDVISPGRTPEELADKIDQSVV